MGIFQATDMKRFLNFALLLALTAQPGSSRTMVLKLNVRDYRESPASCKAPNGMIQVRGRDVGKHGNAICHFKCRDNTEFVKYCEDIVFTLLRTKNGNVYPQHCGTCDLEELAQCIERKRPIGMTTLYGTTCHNSTDAICKSICLQNPRSLLNCHILKLKHDKSACNKCNEICIDLRKKKCQHECKVCDSRGCCERCINDCEEIINRRPKGCYGAPQFS